MDFHEGDDAGQERLCGGIPDTPAIPCAVGGSNGIAVPSRHALLPNAGFINSSCPNSWGEANATKPGWGGFGEGKHYDIHLWGPPLLFLLAMGW